MNSLLTILVSALSISAFAPLDATKQCAPGTVILVGWYAQPGSYTDTTCFKDSVLFDTAGGYKQCIDNVFVHKDCECEGHSVRKTGMFLQCDKL